jgi:hypothetical protein
MKYYEKRLGGYHIAICGHRKIKRVLFFIVNTPKLELGPDLESLYKLCNFSVYVYLLHS